jgi:O-antigen ligase
MRRAEAGLLILALIGLAAIPFVSLETDSLWQRFVSLAADPSASMADRAMARKAAAEMRRDRPLLGWGAGCFRFGFPNYTRWHPEIDTMPGSRERRYWEHAHDDLMEFPIEFGDVGLAPPAVAIGWAVVQLVRRRFWNHPVALCSVLGCLVLLLHAGFDFVLQNPAVLITSCVLFFGAIRWAELEGTVPTQRKRAVQPFGIQD